MDDYQMHRILRHAEETVEGIMRSSWKCLEKRSLPRSSSSSTRRNCNAPYPALSLDEFAAIRDGCCPDCGGTSFLSGPCGGCSENIKCANPECGSEFNICPPYFAERISERRFQDHDDG